MEFALSIYAVYVVACVSFSRGSRFFSPPFCQAGLSAPVFHFCKSLNGVARKGERCGFEPHVANFSANARMRNIATPIYASSKLRINAASGPEPATFAHSAGKVIEITICAYGFPICVGGLGLCTCLRNVPAARRPRRHLLQIIAAGGYSN